MKIGAWLDKISESAQICITGFYRITSNPLILDFVQALERRLLHTGWPPPLFYISDYWHKKPPPPDHHVSGFVFLSYAISDNFFVPCRDRPSVPQVVLDVNDMTPESRSEQCRHFYKLRFAHYRSGLEIACRLAP